MSQLVAVSSPASGREVIQRYRSARAAFFPVRRVPPKKPKAVHVYPTPLIIESLVLPAILDQLAEAARISEEAAKAAAEPRRILVTDVIAEVSRHFRVTRTDLLSARRTRTVSRPRQVAMYLAGTVTTRSLPEIGRILGGKDHTSVLHGKRKIAALIEAGDPIAADVEAIRARLLA